MSATKHQYNDMEHESWIKSAEQTVSLFVVINLNLWQLKKTSSNLAALISTSQFHLCYLSQQKIYVHTCVHQRLSALPVSHTSIVFLWASLLVGGVDWRWCCNPTQVIRCYWPLLLEECWKGVKMSSTRPEPEEHPAAEVAQLNQVQEILMSFTTIS